MGKLGCAGCVAPAGQWAGRRGGGWPGCARARGWSRPSTCREGCVGGAPPPPPAPSTPLPPPDTHCVLEVYSWVRGVRRALRRLSRLRRRGRGRPGRRACFSGRGCRREAGGAGGWGRWERGPCGHAIGGRTHARRGRGLWGRRLGHGRRGVCVCVWGGGGSVRGAAQTAAGETERRASRGRRAQAGARARACARAMQGGPETGAHIQGAGGWAKRGGGRAPRHGLGVLGPRGGAGTGPEPLSTAPRRGRRPRRRTPAAAPPGGAAPWAPPRRRRAAWASCTCRRWP